MTFRTIGLAGTQGIPYLPAEGTDSLNTVSHSLLRRQSYSDGSPTLTAVPRRRESYFDGSPRSTAVPGRRQSHFDGSPRSTAVLLRRQSYFNCGPTALVMYNSSKCGSWHVESCVHNHLEFSIRKTNTLHGLCLLLC